MALMDMARQLAVQATSLAFQDVFRITAVVTIPAIFLPFLLRLRAAPAAGQPAPMASE
jgi:hypothetical protein